MKRAYIWTIIFAVLVVGLSSVTLIGAPMPVGVRVMLSQIIGVALLHTGVAVVFLLALRGYKQRLRVAYRYIYASMILVAFGMLQYVVIGTLDLVNSPWVVIGGPAVAFVVIITYAKNYSTLMVR